MGDEKTFLDGAVAVDRVPPTAQLTTSDDDEDYPAVARRGENIAMSFVRFSHGDRAMESSQKIEDMARPTAGDQVFSMSWSQAANKWGAAIPVSPKGEDSERTAVAIDGSGRTWVIWSAQRQGNFDIYARVGTNGAFGPEIRVTSDPGTDLNPVAATDSSGRVWIAWQGYRGNLEILSAVQDGDRFSHETTVSVSPASDWDPSIASAPNSDIAIAWDTYDKGNYDVWFRRLRIGPDAKAGSDITMDEPVAVAETPNFEARASIAFDPRSRLWVAWEVASPRWGKQFGSYESTGTPLYEAHDVRVRCFDGDTVYATSSDLINAMPGAPAPLRRARGNRPGRDLPQPDPSRAKNRRAGTVLGPRNGVLNSWPRLAVDPAGGVYLAFRSLAGPANSRSVVGSVWTEHVDYFDGHSWTGPILLPRTDGLLDNRPALLALDAGHLLTVSSMDHRQSTPQGLGQGAADRINADLYSADLRLDTLPPVSQKPELMTMQKERPAQPDARSAAEREQVGLMRNYRIAAGGQQLRILRGDFHRHSEYSPEVARDGSLEDAYRYMIDAASLDWGGCCDNENGGSHEYFWWTQQKTADKYLLGDRFIPMFAYEHAVRYPEGHRVVLLAKRGVRPAPHRGAVPVDSPPAPAPDTQLLYQYLKMYGGISVPHATTTDQGTDWRDHDPNVEPVVEIYQGQRQSYERADAPRDASPEDAMNGWRPLGLVTAALDKGYRLGFAASSDHHSNHIAFTSVLAASSSREAILQAMRQRHVYASTDNIVADVRCGDHLMGDEFTVNGPVTLSGKLIGSAPVAKITIVKDGHDVFKAEPKLKEANFEWTDRDPVGAGGSYYYVRGEQSDGQLVWTSPMWIKRQ